MSRAIWRTFQPQPSKFFSKKNSYSFPQRILIWKFFSFSQESNPALSDLSPQTFFPRIIFIYFNKKRLFWKHFLYFFKKSFPNFQEAELSYIFYKKIFRIFWERCIQNPSLTKLLLHFRKGIFRTFA